MMESGPRKGAWRADALLLLLAAVAALCVRLPAVGLSDLERSQPELFATARGEVFFQDPDSYFFLRQAQGIVDGGEAAAVSGLPSLTALAYRFLNAFHTVSIEQTASALSVLLSVLVIFPAYFFVKRYTNPLGGLAAAVLAATSPSFAMKTWYGTYDTDALLMLLPMLTLCGMMNAMCARRLRAQLLWAFASALSLYGIARVWTAYRVYLYAVLALGFLYLLGALLIPGAVYAETRRPRGRVGKALRLPSTRGMALSVCGALAVGFAWDRLRALSELVPAMGVLSEAAADGSYPLATPYVAELQRIPLIGREMLANTGSISGLLGGMPVCALALAAGAAWIALAARALWRARKKLAWNCAVPRRNVLVFLTVLLPWAAIGLMLAARGQRYAQIAAIPVSLLGGLGIGLFGEFAFRRLRGSGVRSTLGKGGVLLLSLAVAVSPVPAVYRLAGDAKPVVNAVLAQACAALRTETTPDAELLSWWDYGYYYEYAGERRAVFHGGIFSGEAFYYLGHMLMADTSELSAGLCRMLSSSFLRAPDLLAELTGSVIRASDILMAILPLSKENARAALCDEYGLSEADALRVLELSHPEQSAPLCLALTSDMLSKLPAIAYYGFYDLAEGASPAVFYAATAESQPYTQGEVCALSLYGTQSVSLRVLVTEDALSATGSPARIGRYVLMKDGETVSDICASKGEKTLIVQCEGGRMSAVLTDSAVADSTMMRLYLFGEAEVDACFAKLWEGSAETGEESGVQRKLNTAGSTPCAAQIWSSRQNDTGK